MVLVEEEVLVEEVEAEGEDEGMKIIRHMYVSILFWIADLQLLFCDLLFASITFQGIAIDNGSTIVGCNIIKYQIYHNFRLFSREL